MEILLLGPVRVLSRGRRVDVGGRKRRLLLAVLALEVNRQVTVARLIELLWPDDTPATARGMIHTNVSQLRMALRRVTEQVKAKAGTEAAYVDREPGGYALRCDPDRIDVHRFRGLIAEARGAYDGRRVPLLTDALELWQGPALAGTAPEEVRIRLCGGLEEARLAAIEDLVEARLRLGHRAGLLDELVSLAGEHPLRPRLSGALMRVLHDAGRTADALAVYDRLRRALRDERGLDPPEELRDLQLSLLRGEPVLDPPLLFPAMDPAASRRPPRTPPGNW